MSNIPCNKDRDCEQSQHSCTNSRFSFNGIAIAIAIAIAIVFSILVGYLVGYTIGTHQILSVDFSITAGDNNDVDSDVSADCKSDKPGTI
jgi:hypothetical protein